MINGIINIYKEQGFTSHDVVAKLRRILNQKKIGHTGTLDPDAVGVLPVCLGKGTKLSDMLTDTDKVYEVILLLGVSTDTEDITGSIIETKDVISTEEEIKDTILDFIGEYAQTPPMYSAVKVNGKKLYELARKGIEIERKPRNITIRDIRNIEIDMSNTQVKMLVECSKGTYIRTLCKDIGEKLGCGGCMKLLTRTRVSSFEINQALTLLEVEKIFKEGKIYDYIVRIEDMFQQYDNIIVKEEYNTLIYNGNVFDCKCIKNYNEHKEYTEHVKVYDENNSFIGIYRYIKEQNQYKLVKNFYEGNRS